MSKILRAFLENERGIKRYLSRFFSRSQDIDDLTQDMEDYPDSSVLGAGDQVTAEDVVEGRRKMAVFAEAIAALPPQCRRVFVLRKVQGLSQKDVARQLGLSVSTVEKHLATGLLKCSEYLRLRGYEVGGSPLTAPGKREAPRYGTATGSGSDV